MLPDIYMKKFILICFAMLGIQQSMPAQSHFSFGLGYFGKNLDNAGLVVQFEYEKFHAGSVSLPLRANLGHFSNPDYQALFIDFHKGFRKHFSGGLFIEQSLGAGLITKKYNTGMWYVDKYAQSVLHNNQSTWGFMPSVTAGVGYNFGKNNKGDDLLWIRPKVYWDLGFRALYLPYWALQIGFTHTFSLKY